MIRHAVKTRKEGIELASNLFIELAEANPQRPVGLATGGTMEGIYAELASREYSPSCNDAFALDEYLGLKPGDKNSYVSELRDRFARQLKWSGELHVPGQGPYSGPDGLELFEIQLASRGPISVQLLGLGVNGHVAFNEPGAAFDSRTRVVELHQETVDANSRFFEDSEQMPTHAYSQGLATIKQATALLLVVFGEQKRVALLQALENPTALTPLAALLDHPQLHLVSDQI